MVRALGLYSQRGEKKRKRNGHGEENEVIGLSQKTSKWSVREGGGERACWPRKS